MKAGIVVFAHGSRIESANQAVRDVAEALARADGLDVEAAFLELGQPDMEGAVARLAGRGLQRIVVVPYFLTLGLHMERDLPVIVGAIMQKRPDLEISITPPLDGHPALVEILRDRSRSALS